MALQLSYLRLMKKALALKAALAKFIQINPSVVIFSGLLNGIIPALCFSDLHFLLLLTYAGFSSLILLFISKKIFAKFAISSTLGLLLVHHTMTPAADHYCHLLPNRSCGAQIEVLVSDATAVSGNIDWLPLPKLVKAEVLRFRYSPVDKWRDVSGKTFLRFPRNTSMVAYGDVLQISGFFSFPGTESVGGGFNFTNYLKSQGVKNCFIVNDQEPFIKLPRKVSAAVKTAESIFKIRDTLLDGISESMELPYRRMLAAILFGCRQGLNYDSRNQFKQSGVMHIFAISVLHS